VKNKPKKRKIEDKNYKNYLPVSKTSSSQPTVSVSTYTVVDEMAQAFSPMGIVLDFTPVNAPSPNTTQVFPPVITTLGFTPAKAPSSNASILACG
jgi:hypothetical protein